MTTKLEYARYESAVRDFFEREGINNLSGGHLSCPSCGPDTYDESKAWGDDDKCPDCGADREACNEPFFSWTPCDCCHRPLGGNREHATGYNPTTKEIQEYTVCEDCIYYAEYGRLDDMTMLEVEDDDSHVAAKEWLDQHGYKYGTRKDQTLPNGLADRMAECKGLFIVFDPNDDEDGFCIVGDDLDLLVVEAQAELDDEAA